jgi:hypothetical protein
VIIGSDLSISGQEAVESCCEHENGHLDSIKDGKFLDYLSDYQLLKKALLHRSGYSCVLYKNYFYTFVNYCKGKVKLSLYF